MSTHIFTSAAANYIPKARVLAHSIKRFHPDLHVHLVLSDAVPEGLCPQDEPFDSVLTLADLGIRSPKQWAFKHNIVELSTAVKGPALVKLLETPGCTEVIYFDPDIVILSSLSRLLDEFRSGDVLLTPHVTEPERTIEAIRDNEVAALRYGIYNLGFLGVRNSEDGRRFARWWSSRLLEFCYDDMPQGLFTDQRWVDLALAYFPGCRILRDPVYNVCTWNLTNRRVAGTLATGLSVNGQAIVFYHFSGFDGGAQLVMLDKYGKQMHGLYELRRWYEAECERMQQRLFAKIPWQYGYFDNGEPVTDSHRRLYRERADLQRAFGEPFATGDRNQSYFHWYEANGEAIVETAGSRPLADLFRLRVLVRHARTLLAKSPEYRVFLSVSEADAAHAAAAARALLERTRQAAGLFVIGPRRVVEKATGDALVGSRIQGIALGAGATHDQAFGEICRRFADRGFLFVKASTVVTEHWDERLVWSLAGQQGIATVSPLCDREPFTALNPDGDSPVKELSTETLDRMCALYSEIQHPEIPRCLEDCVYVSADAARAAHGHFGDLAPEGVDSFDRFHRAMRDLRYSHMLADHVYVGSHAPPAKRTRAATAAVPRALLDLRRVLRTKSVSGPGLPAVTKLMTPRHLHIMHSWGGGLERWVQEYCRADRAHENFVLKSVGAPGASGRELHLYRQIDDVDPLKIWPLNPVIKGTVAAHAGYAEALSEIIDDFGIERILVSSLIGHSLEALRGDPATVMVCHDYYPFCPAVNVIFGQTPCRRCEEEDLVECTRSNPHHRFFPNLPPAYWLGLRSEFLRQVRDNHVALVAPTPSVPENYVRLAPELEGRFRVIPHGTSRLLGPPLRPGDDPRKRLRVVIVGDLAPHKGLFLFREIVDDLVGFADVYLVGCGDWGEEFRRTGITQVPKYERAELPGVMERIRPDLGLLLSVWPETYSYTLQELFELGIPPLATRVGSFRDRIEDGVNGFLCEASAPHVLGRLRELAADRAALIAVHERLGRTPARTVPEMLEDYRGLLQSAETSAAAYFCADARHADSAMPRSIRPRLFWKSAGEGYTEPNSAGCHFRPESNAQALVLRIRPLQAPPDQLRLDPSDEPGVLVVHGIQLRSSTRDCLWSWDGEPGLFSGDRCAQISVLVKQADGGVLLCMTGDDPQVILPIDPIALAAVREGGTLELEISSPPEGRDLLRLAESLGRDSRGLPVEQRQQLARRLAVLRSSGARATRTPLPADRLAAELALARARIGDLQTSWSWRLTSPLRAAAGFVFKLARLLPGRATPMERR